MCVCQTVIDVFERSWNHKPAGGWVGHWFSQYQQLTSPPPETQTREGKRTTKFSLPFATWNHGISTGVVETRYMTSSSMPCHGNPYHGHRIPMKMDWRPSLKIVCICKPTCDHGTYILHSCTVQSKTPWLALAFEPIHQGSTCEPPGLSPRTLLQPPHPRRCPAEPVLRGITAKWRCCTHSIPCSLRTKTSGPGDLSPEIHIYHILGANEYFKPKVCSCRRQNKSLQVGLWRGTRFLVQAQILLIHCHCRRNGLKLPWIPPVAPAIWQSDGYNHQSRFLQHETTLQPSNCIAWTRARKDDEKELPPCFWMIQVRFKPAQKKWACWMASTTVAKHGTPPLRSPCLPSPQPFLRSLNSFMMKLKWASK